MMAKQFVVVDSVMSKMAAAERPLSFVGDLAAVKEYLVAEVWSWPATPLATTRNLSRSIIPRLLQLAICNDEELSKLLNGVTTTQGGVLPKIQTVFTQKD